MSSVNSILWISNVHLSWPFQFNISDGAKICLDSRNWVSSSPPIYLPGFLEAKIAGLWVLGWVHATIETPGSHTRGALPPLPYHTASYHTASYLMTWQDITWYHTHSIISNDIIPHDIARHDHVSSIHILKIYKFYLLLTNKRIISSWYEVSKF